jgi:hypothetical protein
VRPAAREPARHQTTRRHAAPAVSVPRTAATERLSARAANVTAEDLAETTPHGPDPEPYLDQIRRYDEAGFTHVYIHQIGDNQEEFADFARRALMPRL